jgi:SOS response regulatory protein OraA/RecX
MFSFYYIDKNDEKHTFTQLSERMAKSMYKAFLRESVIHGYKQIGWQKNDGSYATGTSC